MVQKSDSKVPDCGCSFVVDEHGVPTVECPDADAQDMAFQALRQHPDVAIRVTPTLEPEVEDGIQADDMDPGVAEDDDLDFEDDDEEDAHQDT